MTNRALRVCPSSDTSTSCTVGAFRLGGCVATDCRTVAAILVSVVDDDAALAVLAPVPAPAADVDAEG